MSEKIIGFRKATLVDLMTPGVRVMHKKEGYEGAMRLGLVGLGVKWYWPKQAKEVARLLVEEIAKRPTS